MVNEKKSRLQVSQHFQHLGLFFDLSLQVIRPADHLITKVIESVSALDPDTLLITPRTLSRIIGLINFVGDSSSWDAYIFALYNTGWPGVGLRRTKIWTCRFAQTQTCFMLCLRG